MNIILSGAHVTRRGPAEWFIGTVWIVPVIEAPAAEHTNDMIVNADASFLLCGGSGITIRLLHNLQIVFKMDVGSEVTSLALTHDDRILFVGLKSGHMLLCATCFTNSLSMTPPLQSPRVSSVTSSPSTTPRT